MKTTLKTNFIFTFIVLLSVTSSYAQLTHPGGWLTSTDLSRIREKVASGEEPWASAWNAVKNKRTINADVSSTITDRGALQKQGESAFILAIKWVVTGDKSFANQGINIINAWANTVDRFDIGDTPLRIGIGSNMMANAAEILAWGFNGEAGWSSRDIERAQTWFKDVVYPLTSTGRSRSMNWGTSALAGNMSMAIFTDDNRMFNDAIDAYKFGFTNTNDGCAGVTQYIVNEEGQCFESERDQGHTQGGIAHLVEPAMIAWNQGVDLVSYEKNRLVAGMEYTARYNLGNNVPFVDNVINPCNLSFSWMSNGRISSDDRGDFSPVYVMATTLFEYADKDHPYTDEVASLSSYFPEKGNSDHPGMGHLLYSGASTNNPPPTTGGGALVHITKRNANTFAIDGGNGGGNGQNIYLWSSKTTNVNQQWVEIDRGNGYYSYQKANTNYCIDGGNGGKNGQNVYLWKCKDSNQNQHWKKVNVGGGNYRLEKRNASGYSIDGGNNGTKGQNIYLWKSSNTNQNQHWNFNSVNKNLEVERLVDNSYAYPLPFSNLLNINLGDNQQSNAKVDIINVSGQIVFSKNITNNDETLQLSNLASGLFIAKITSDDGVQTIKIIKE